MNPIEQCDSLVLMRQVELSDEAIEHRKKIVSLEPIDLTGC